MDKVWLVTAGEYSDYSIMRACSTRELAEEYVALHSKSRFWWGPVRIEELDVDTSPENFYPIWSVEDRTIHGKGLTVTRLEFTAHPIGMVWQVDDHQTRFRWPAVVVQARDEDHAIKIAAEKFAQYRAEKAGIA